MSSPETFIAYGAVMLVIALLAVAIDWFGKPLRHRKFVPKIYRFPDERVPRHAPTRRTPWSESALVLPMSEAMLETPRRPPLSSVVIDPTGPQPGLLDRFNAGFAPPRTLEGNQRVRSPYPDEQQADPNEPVVVRPETATGTGDTLLPPHDGSSVLDTDIASAGAFASAAAVPESAAPAGRPQPDIEPEPAWANADERVFTHEESPAGRSIGWAPGEDVYNLEDDGSEPSPAEVRQRFWRNVEVAGGASLFGEASSERLAAGLAPQRRNPRTGKTETMRLPSLSYADNNGLTPVPNWPTRDIDPFADGSGA